MDKAILKKFAIESRQELMSKVANKIKTFYINEDFSKEQTGDIIVLSNEKYSLSLSKKEYEDREKLKTRVKELGLEQVIEEAAYTWFNRIIAIRYMEIHDYLPLTKDNRSLGIRVLSSKDNTPDPEIMKFTNLTNPDLDIDLKKEKYIELKDDNKKFEYILLLVCKKLGKVIPQVFDGVTDYIDILIPENLLNESGYINKVLRDVSEDNYDQVEIIGWLYQFYNSNEKDRVMASTRAKKNYQKCEIPYVTQIFTPDWIVKYMVENTLIRYCVEHKIIDLKFAKDIFKYFDNSSIEIKDELNVEEIKFIDPCCGSGHIVIYAFEVLYKIYLFKGYKKEEISKLILLNNIFGTDIDNRATQLSILSIVLKCREFDKNIFNENVINKLNISSIPESNNYNNIIIDDVTIESQEIIKKLYNKFYNGKEIGSLIDVDDYDYQKIIDEINDIDNIFSIDLRNKIIPLIKVAKILNTRYDITVTNPPYLGNAYMSTFLYEYVEKNYSASKIDLFSAFISKERKLTKENGYYSAIVLPSFLFLKSFSKLRKDIVHNQTIVSLLHMGRGVFGIDFGSTAFVLKNSISNNFIGKYYKLYNKTFQYIDVEDIKNIYLNSLNDSNYQFDFMNYNTKTKHKEIFEKVIYYNNQRNFEKIKETPISYWIMPEEFERFKKNKTFGDLFEIRGGMTTSNTDLFLKYWWEIDFNKIGFNMSKTVAKESNKKWFPYNKGGNYKKWYGNRDYVIDWMNDGYNIKQYKLKQREKDPKFNIALAGLDSMFNMQLSWSLVSAGKFSARCYEKGFLFDVSGCCVLPNEVQNSNYILGLMNSNVVERYLKAFNPTMNTTPGDVKNLLYLYDEKIEKEIDDLVERNIELSKEDWNIKENSWDFKFNIKNGKCVKQVVSNIIELTTNMFNETKKNEEKINELFINLYNLNGILHPEVDDEDISIDKISKEEIVRKILSYAVGCMFGRYSLDEEGLVYAGGDFDISRYKTFEVDTDNIIPITDEAYFGDNIVERFKDFLVKVYGKETLNENMDYIAEVLGKKGTETSEETIRRYFVNDFFNDHIKMYQKRPIYWLLDSGKKNGFKALIYMHRYNENLIPKARLDYLHRIQTIYEKLLSDVNYKLTTDLSMTDKKEAKNRQTDLMAKLQEIKEYDEKIAHIANQRISIDLDDGVKVNYEKFKDILAKIK